MLVVAAIGFVIYALGSPELSFPWSMQITHILYGLYAAARLHRTLWRGSGMDCFAEAGASGMNKNKNVVNI